MSQGNLGSVEIGLGHRHHDLPASRYPSPVIQEVVLKDLQEGPTEVLQELSILLNPLHVLKEALCRIPDLKPET